jgi:hypothetical protein
MSSLTYAAAFSLAWLAGLENDVIEFLWLIFKVIGLKELTHHLIDNVRRIKVNG